MTTVINLRAAISATVGHENQYGHRCGSLTPPKFPTFLGCHTSEKRTIKDCDTWTFFITFRFGSRVTETFYGLRAYNLWAEWKQRQFSSNAKKRKTKTNERNKLKRDTDDRREDNGQLSFASIE